MGISHIQSLLQKLSQQNKPVLDRLRLTFCNIGNCHTISKVYKLRSLFPQVDITAEVPYPYLCFDSERIKLGDTRFKNEPAITNEANRKMLLSALDVDRCVQVISSYHHSFNVAYKSIETGNFFTAVNGFYSIGATLQALWTKYWVNIKKVISESSLGKPIPVIDRMRQDLIQEKIRKIVYLTSINPAISLGIDRHKGSIQVGQDADLVIWNPMQVDQFSTKKSQKSYLMSSKYHLMNNKKLYGIVYHTLVRGVEVYRRTSESVKFNKNFQSRQVTP